MNWKATIELIAVITIITSVAMFSGCLEEKISAVGDLGISSSFMDSGESKVEKIDIDPDTYLNTRTNLLASKVDYELALNILNNATTDYDEEREIIELNKIICSYNLDYVNVLQNLNVCLKHLDKAYIYMVGDDLTSIRSELKISENAINEAALFTTYAKEKCNGIDIDIDADTLSEQSKSKILEDRISIEENEKMIVEIGKMISGLYPYVNGTEHLSNAVSYIDDENWSAAKTELKKSSSNFSKSKNIFEDLKNSEFSEVSYTAIAIDGALGKMIECVGYYERGCKYADGGDFKNASYEFGKGLIALESVA